MVFLAGKAASPPKLPADQSTKVMPPFCLHLLTLNARSAGLKGLTGARSASAGRGSPPAHLRRAADLVDSDEQADRIFQIRPIT